MATFLSRIALFGIGAAAGAVLYMLAAPSQSPDALAQAQIDDAVASYAAQMQAEREAASDNWVTTQANKLFRNSDDPVIGNASGDVALVTFFDYTCVFCKAADPRVKQLIDDDDGVKLVLKEYPILTPESLIASKAALASKSQGLYEDFHNAMMAFRGQLTEARIFEMAAEVGLDVDRLREDMESPDIAEQILDNFNLARALRIFQTPTFIIDNHIVTQPSAEIDFPQLVADARAH